MAQNVILANPLMHHKNNNLSTKIKKKLTQDIWRQIIKLDNLEQFEESYSLTQEWREWLLDSQINNNF